MRPREGTWTETLRNWASAGTGQIHFVGVGNPIKGDDAAGIEVARTLRRTLGASPKPGIRIHGPTIEPGREISKIPLGDRVVLFDAVEANREPGEIVCALLDQTKYGFFATHNIPLKLVPGLGHRKGGVLMVGIQPLSLEVGEDLSDRIKESVSLVAKEVARLAEGQQ